MELPSMDYTILGLGYWALVHSSLQYGEMKDCSRNPIMMLLHSKASKPLFCTPPFAQLSQFWQGAAVAAPSALKSHITWIFLQLDFLQLVALHYLFLLRFYVNFCAILLKCKKERKKKKKVGKLYWIHLPSERHPVADVLCIFKQIHTSKCIHLLTTSIQGVQTSFRFRPHFTSTNFSEFLTQ